MTLHMQEVKHSVLQSHPPCFKCSVASCGQVPRCWTEQMFRVPSSQRILLDIPLQITEGQQREHLPQGGFASVVWIHWYLQVLSFLLLVTKAKDLRILCLLSYQLGHHVLGSPKRRDEDHNIMRTQVWTELEKGAKIKLQETLVAHWAVCVWCLSWLRTKPPKNSFTKKCQDR